jgi:SAM-dependent methyltransferase
MLARARERAADEQLTNVSFVQADAQVHDFDRGAFDVVISRFGAMFFADPVAAFANIATALHPDARLALVVWMPLERNEWLSVIREALAMGRALPAPQVGSPGPFGLADPGHVRTTLEAGGYADIAVDEFHSTIEAGSDPDDAFTFVGELPPVMGMVEELDDTDTAEALDRLHAALAEHATPDGVQLGAAAWVVTARRL